MPGIVNAQELIPEVGLRVTLPFSLVSSFVVPYIPCTHVDDSYGSYYGISQADWNIFSYLSLNIFPLGEFQSFSFPLSSLLARWQPHVAAQHPSLPASKSTSACVWGGHTEQYFAVGCGDFAQPRIRPLSYSLALFTLMLTSTKLSATFAQHLNKKQHIGFAVLRESNG